MDEHRYSLYVENDEAVDGFEFYGTYDSKSQAEDALMVYTEEYGLVGLKFMILAGGRKV